MNLFIHPLQDFLEGYLLSRGIVVEQTRHQNVDGYTYLFCGASGTTVVLRLYNHAGSGQETKSWLCFEFGVGLVSANTFNVNDLCEQMYSCYLPLRPVLMQDGDGKMLILMIRAEHCALDKGYLPTLIEMAEILAGEIRDKWSMEKVA